MKRLIVALLGLMAASSAIPQASPGGNAYVPTQIVAGTNVTISPTNGLGTVTINATGGGGTGTVTSVAFADGSSTPIFTITGSPVTTTGTLTETLATQSANAIFAGPTSGGVGQPTFRSLVTADLPAAFGTPTSLTLTNATGLPTTGLTGTLGVTSGGNGLATATLGDLRYGSGTNTLAALAGNTTATKNFLTQTGTGAVSAIPAWGAIVAADINTLSPSFASLTSTAAANLASGLTQASNTSVDGLTLIDSTAATAANQQYSPRLRFTGQGWKTTATAGSQTVDWVIENRPSQGSTSPGAALTFLSQINGGGFVSQGSLNSSGNFAATGSISTTNSFGMATTILSLTGAGVPVVGINNSATNVLSFFTASTSAANVDATQHWRLGGTATPTIASGACGTGANGTLSAAANDHAGEINIGAAATTTCAIVFSAAYTTAPRAVILTPGNAAAVGATVLPFVSAVSTTGFTVTGSILASTSFYYWVQ